MGAKDSVVGAAVSEGRSRYALAVSELVDAWEAFHSGRAGLPALVRFLPASGPRRDALLALAPIDMERRWTLLAGRDAPSLSQAMSDSAADALGARPLLEDYTRVYPDLGPVQRLPVEFVAWECYLRRGEDDRPTAEEYHARFPDLDRARFKEHLARFQRGDSLVPRRAMEDTNPPGAGPTPSPSERATVAPRAPRTVTFDPTDRAEGERGADASIPSLLPDFNNHPRYKLLGVLGSGGMGSVYKAQHQVMDRLVAIKVIQRSLVDQPALVDRFYQEVRAAAQLSHPHVVAAYDAERVGDTHYLVMEYVEGVDLGAVVKRRLKEGRGPLPIRHACNYVRQAVLGLQHAHEKGMVHRDIKPHNLIMTSSGRVKILDFGLARLASEKPTGGQSLTGTGAMMGTPDYLAPEQARDARRADIRADLYSIGCTLYYLLTGRPVFAGDSTLEKVVAHLEQEPPRLCDARPDAPRELEQIVTKLLQKQPADRYQTPSELAAALLPFAVDSATRRALEAQKKPSRERPTETTRPRETVVVDDLEVVPANPPAGSRPTPVPPVRAGGRRGRANQCAQ